MELLPVRLKTDDYSGDGVEFVALVGPVTYDALKLHGGWGPAPMFRLLEGSDVRKFLESSNLGEWPWGVYSDRAVVLTCDEAIIVPADEHGYRFEDNYGTVCKALNDDGSPVVLPW